MLAAKLVGNIDRAAIARIEIGQSSISLDRAVAIASALGVTLQTMLGPGPIKIEVE